MPVDPSEPHVWWARRQDASPRLERLLDGPEVERLSAYVRAEDRARFLVGCGLAKLVLARQLGREATEIRLSRACPRCGRPHGKPRLAAPVVTAPPELSISHSGELVAVAVTARAPVGIDVERYDRALPIQDLEEVVLAETERRELARLGPGDRARGFLTWWTRKEAVVKASGVGVLLPLDAVVVSRPDEPARLLQWPRPVPAEDVALFDLGEREGHLASLAVLGPCRHVRQFDGSGLLYRV